LTTSPVGQDGVERSRELSGSIADEEPKPGDVAAEVDDEVAGLLHNPGVIRVGGDPKQVDPAGGHLHHHQHGQASQQDRVDMEEIEREQTVCLRAQERPPAGVHPCVGGSSGGAAAAGASRAAWPG
jgi:hypothetical protein